MNMIDIDEQFGSASGSHFDSSTSSYPPSLSPSPSRLCQNNSTLNSGVNIMFVRAIPTTFFTVCDLDPDPQLNSQNSHRNQKQNFKRKTTTTVITQDDMNGIPKPKFENGDEDEDIRLPMKIEELPSRSKLSKKFIKTESLSKPKARQIDYKYDNIIPPIESRSQSQSQFQFECRVKENNENVYFNCPDCPMRFKLEIELFSHYRIHQHQQHQHQPQQFYQQTQNLHINSTSNSNLKQADNNNNCKQFVKQEQQEQQNSEPKQTKDQRTFNFNTKPIPHLLDPIFLNNLNFDKQMQK